MISPNSNHSHGSYGSYTNKKKNIILTTATATAVVQQQRRGTYYNKNRRKQKDACIELVFRRALLLFVLFLIILFIGYIYFLYTIFFASNNNSNTIQQSTIKQRKEEEENIIKHYNEWKEIAINLAKLTPIEILNTLENDDPFHVRTFHKLLKQREKQLKEDTGNDNSILSIEEIKQLFPCNNNTRISLPDQRDKSKINDFKNNKHGTFLFFQHLRKAGGTNFCTLATANMPKEHLPPYYCMPDFYWKIDGQNKNYPCAGCLHHYTNKQIIDNMKQYRIAGNEWDSFNPNVHFNLPAIFVTSFRSPVDRALSQYRFECVENRGCKIHDVIEWWNKRRDLYNVYTWTFSDINKQAKYVNSQNVNDIEKRIKSISIALDTISKFHLILYIDYLKYSIQPVEDVLGFINTNALYNPTRPHNQQKQRKDTWKSTDYLNKIQYQQFAINLALDEILTDVARRFFLERLVCDY